MNGIPARLIDINIGILAFRWLHSAVLSPVQIAPVKAGKQWHLILDWDFYNQTKATSYPWIEGATSTDMIQDMDEFPTTTEVTV